MGSRRNSHHPSAAALFDGHETIVETNTDPTSDDLESVVTEKVVTVDKTKPPKVTEVEPSSSRT